MSEEVEDEVEENQGNMDFQFEHVKRTLPDPTVSIQKVQCGVSPLPVSHNR